MSLRVGLFIILSSINLFAAKRCLLSVTQHPAEYLGEQAAKREAMDWLEEIDALDGAKEVRLKSDGLLYTAAVTQIRVSIGQLTAHLQNNEIGAAVRMYRRIFRLIPRAYFTVENNQASMNEAAELMGKGELDAAEGQAFIARLEAESQEAMRVFGENYDLYNAVRGYLEHAANDGSPLPLDTTAEVEFSGGVPNPERKARAEEVLNSLNSEVLKMAEMFPDTKFGELPTRAQLQKFFSSRPYTPEMLVAKLKKENSLDQKTSWTLFWLSESGLGLARKLVDKFVPTKYQGAILDTMDLGYDNYSLKRFTGDIFHLLHVAKANRLREARKLNAPTNGQFLVALARIFPRTYTNLLVEAAKEGSAEATLLGETPPENLIVFSEDGIKSPQDGITKTYSESLAFYYQMLIAQRTAIRLGSLSIDNNGVRSERVGRLLLGGGALGIVGGTAAYNNWGTLSPILHDVLQKMMSYLHF